MIFFKSSLENDKSVIFEALENEVSSGKCRLIIDGVKAEIVSINFDETKTYIFEGLVKSAFNYACLKDCYMGYVSDIKFSDLLKKMGFKNNNGAYYNDIPAILQGNCCKNK